MLILVFLRKSFEPRVEYERLAKCQVAPKRVELWAEANNLMDAIDIRPVWSMSQATSEARGSNLIS
jgi:hypothetical protein